MAKAVGVVAGVGEMFSSQTDATSNIRQIEARMAVFEFIEGWYGPNCRHSALGYRSPIDYEKTDRQNTGYRSPSPSTEAG
jgi:transposase InsO family protein